MTDQTNTGTRNDKAKGKIEKEFEALPLDEKFRQLFKFEAATLSEAMSYLVNSSSRVFEDIGNAMSDIGKKVEHEVKKETTTCESEASAGSGQQGSTPGRSAAAKKPRPSAKP